MNELQELANTICDDWGVPRIKLYAGRSRRQYGCFKSWTRAPKRFTCPWRNVTHTATGHTVWVVIMIADDIVGKPLAEPVVLHELAHYLAWHSYPYRIGHGPEFKEFETVLFAQHGCETSVFDLEVA